MIKKGFSVAEATITLLIGSIALGMAAPMITKQMKQNNFSDTQIQVINQRFESFIETTNETIEELRNEIQNSSIPKGTVAFFNNDVQPESNTNPCPAGWSPINNNWNGRFPRFAGSYTILDYNISTKNFDTTGTEQSLNVGETQEDAIRNITGTIPGERADYTNFPYSGPFYQDTTSGNRGWGSADYDNAKVIVDVSRVVPTSTENRPRSVALLGCVKN